MTGKSVYKIGCIMETKNHDRKELIQKFRTEGILDAALRVIARRGLEKATMEQVAEEAGISKATIYLYFKNKDALYFQCVVDRFDVIMEEMRHSVEGVKDPIKKVETLIETQLRAMEAQKDFFRVFLTEKMSIFLDQSTEFGQEFARRHKDYSGLLSGAIEEAMDKKLLRRTDPQRAFYLLFSMVRGMAMFKIFCGDESPLSTESGLILDVFFNGLRSKEKVNQT